MGLRRLLGRRRRNNISNNASQTGQYDAAIQAHAKEKALWQQRVQEANQLLLKIEQEYKQGMESIKSALNNLCASAKKSFKSIRESDQLQIQDINSQLAEKQTKSQVRLQKLETLIQAVTKCEEGDFSKVKGLLEDKILRDVLPEGYQILMGAKLAQKSWLKLEKIRRYQEKNKQQLELILSSESNAATATQESKESQECELKKSKEEKEEQEKNLVEASTKERNIGLIAFEWTLSGKLPAQNGSTFKEQLLRDPTAYENLNKRYLGSFPKTLDEATQRADNFGHFAQTILLQFSEEYEYLFQPAILMALSTAAVALIEKLKKENAPKNEIAKWVQAGLASGLAREFARSSIRWQNAVSILNSVASLITKQPWLREIETLIKLSEKPLQERNKLFLEETKLFEISPIYDYQSHQISYNTSPTYHLNQFNSACHKAFLKEAQNRKAIHPKWTGLLLSYLEITQGNQYPLGDEKILQLAKERARNQDFERRQAEQKEFSSKKALIGKIAFQLYFKGIAKEIFSKKIQKEKQELFESGFRKYKVEFENNFDSLKERDQLIQIAENVLAQVFPLPCLESGVYDLPFDLLQVAFAIAKRKVYEMMDDEADTMSEDALSHFLQAVLYAAYVRKIFSDFPGKFPYSVKEITEQFASVHHLTFLKHYFSQHKHFESGYHAYSIDSHSLEEWSYIFEFCHVSPEFHAGTDKILELRRVSMKNRLHAVSNKGYSLEQLQQADFMEVYLKVMKEGAYPPVYDPKIFQVVINDFNASKKFRKIEDTSEKNKRLLETAVFHMVSNNQFWDKENFSKTLEEALQKMDKKQGISFSIHNLDSKLFKKATYLNRIQRLARTTNDNLSLALQQEEIWKINESYIKKYNSDSNVDAMYLKYKETINMAERCINHLSPMNHFENVDIYKAVVCTRIAVAHALGLKNNSGKHPEDDLLVQAIVYAALIRIFYQRRLYGFLGNGYAATENDNDYQELTTGKYCLKMLEDNPSIQCRDLKYNHEKALSHFLTEFREMILEPSHKLVIENLLIFSRLSGKIQGEKWFHKYFVQSENRWIFLDNYFDLISAYRKITQSGQHPAGDIEILKEAEKLTKLGAESLKLISFKSNLPLVTHPWEMHELDLRGKEDYEIQLIRGIDLEKLMSKQHVLMYQALAKNTIKDVSERLQGSIIQNMFSLNAPDQQLVDYLDNSLIANTDSASGQVISLNPGRVQFRLLEGLNFIIYRRKNGREFHLDCSYSEKGGILKYSLPNQYPCGKSYRVEFKNNISGSLCVQQGSLNRLQSFYKQPYVEFTPERPGPLTLTFSLSNMSDYTVIKQATVLPVPCTEKLKILFKDPNWSEISLNSEPAQNSGVVFKLNNRNFFKVNHGGSLKLWKEVQETQALDPNLHRENYQRRLFELEQFFDKNKYDSEQRMCKAIASAHWLMSKDLTFGPLYVLGHYLSLCGPTHLEEAFIQLLCKQIALYELMHFDGVDSETVSRFIATHKNEFPLYWDSIFLHTHDCTNETLPGFILLTMQTFLSVMGKETLLFDGSKLLEMVKNILSLRNEARYRESEKEILDYFLYESEFDEILADIHERWGHDLDSITDLKHKLEEMKANEERELGMEQARSAMMMGRMRSGHVNLAASVSDTLLEKLDNLKDQSTFFHSHSEIRRYQTQADRDNAQNAVAHHDNQITQLIVAKRDYEIQLENAIREMKRKKRQAIIRSFIGLAVTAIFAPMLAQNIIIGLTKMGMTIGSTLGASIQGMVAGCMNAAITKGNVAKAGVQGFITGGLREILTPAEKLHGINLLMNQVSSEALVSAVNTPFTGGNVFTNALHSSVKTLLIGKPPSQPSFALGSVDMFLALGNSMVRSALDSTIHARLTKTSLRETFLLNMAQAMVHTVASQCGQNLVSKQQTRGRLIQNTEHRLLKAEKEKVAQQKAISKTKIKSASKTPKPKTPSNENLLSEMTLAYNRQRRYRASQVPAKRSLFEKVGETVGSIFWGTAHAEPAFVPEPSSEQLTMWQKHSQLAQKARSGEKLVYDVRTDNKDKYKISAQEREIMNLDMIEDVSVLKAGPKLGAGLQLGLISKHIRSLPEKILSFFKMIEDSEAVMDSPKLQAERAQQFAAIKEEIRKDPVQFVGNIAHAKWEGLKNQFEYIQTQRELGNDFSAGFAMGETLYDAMDFLITGVIITKGVNTTVKTMPKILNNITDRGLLYIASINYDSAYSAFKTTGSHFNHSALRMGEVLVSYYTFPAKTIQKSAILGSVNKPSTQVGKPIVFSYAQVVAQAEARIKKELAEKRSKPTKP